MEKSYGMKKKLVILPLCILFISGCSSNTQKHVSLVQINSRDYGDNKHVMKIVEIERNPKTSKLKLTYEKMGSSVESSMFIMRGFYEVAKARGAEYFINLKEWNDPNEGRIFIAGFTNTKNTNIHDEFGKQFSLKNDYGQARGYMSVSQCNLLWGQSPTSTTNKFSSTAMQVKQGNFFLVKKGNDYAAVKLTRKISKGDGGYKYVWYWQNDGSGSFTNKNAIKGEGEVFEKYLRTRKSATSCTVKDNGGILYIKCKNIKIQWSLNRWIYLSSRESLEIALINKKKIEDIDYLDKNIKWKTNKKISKTTEPRSRRRSHAKFVSICSRRRGLSATGLSRRRFSATVLGDGVC